MTTIKKQFVEISNILEENKNKKVSTILPQLLELMTKANNASGASHTFHKNDDGEVVAVFCYYHKKWELVSQVEYGTKKNTATGLNTMCKVGVSQWTKQQRLAKKEESSLLTRLSSGEVTIEDLPTLQQELNETKKVIIPREDEHGYSSLNEALEA